MTTSGVTDHDAWVRALVDAGQCSAAARVSAAALAADADDVTRANVAWLFLRAGDGHAAAEVLRGTDQDDTTMHLLRLTSESLQGDPSAHRRLLLSGAATSASKHLRYLAARSALAHGDWSVAGQLASDLGEFGELAEPVALRLAVNGEPGSAVQATVLARFATSMAEDALVDRLADRLARVSDREHLLSYLAAGGQTAPAFRRALARHVSPAWHGDRVRIGIAVLLVTPLFVSLRAASLPVPWLPSVVLLALAFGTWAARRPRGVSRSVRVAVSTVWRGWYNPEVRRPQIIRDIEVWGVLVALLTAIIFLPTPEPGGAVDAAGGACFFTGLWLIAGISAALITRARSVRRARILAAGLAAGLDPSACRCLEIESLGPADTHYRVEHLDELDPVTEGVVMLVCPRWAQRFLHVTDTGVAVRVASPTVQPDAVPHE